MQLFLSVQEARVHVCRVYVLTAEGDCIYIIFIISNLGLCTLGQDRGFALIVNSTCNWMRLFVIYHLLTESEVITGNSQIEALMY